MTEESKNKLAEILCNIKEPGTGMSLSKMNLVAGIKHNHMTNELEVFMETFETAKACFIVFQLNSYADIETRLKLAIEKEFPNNKVVFKNA